MSDTDAVVPTHARSSPVRDGRLPILLLGIAFLPTALQATFLPESFFDDFPLGRGWVAGGAPYNEHLVRDVGGLFLALVILSFLAWAHQGIVWALGVAWLVQGVLHAVFHANHLAGYDTIDQIGLMGSLVLVPVLSIWAIWAGRPQPRT